MSLQTMHLRKLLKIMYLERSARIRALREDIRADIAREAGDADGGGGDFYGPFWRDAKDHVFGASDLTEQTNLRIASNSGRKILYNRLKDGFLLWWNERRRWTNEPFRPADSMKTVCRLSDVNADIKFANILPVRDGHNEDHFVYPYWFPEPALADESARLGLWALGRAFPAINPEKFRLLDVIRGQTFSLDRSPLNGNENEIFVRQYSIVFEHWKQLREEY